jgi:hypothetical protein
MVSIGSFSTRKSFQSKNMKLFLYKPLEGWLYYFLGSIGIPGSSDETIASNPFCKIFSGKEVSMRQDSGGITIPALFDDAPP